MMQIKSLIILPLICFIVMTVVPPSKADGDVVELPAKKAEVAWGLCGKRGYFVNVDIDKAEVLDVLEFLRPLVNDQMFKTGYEVVGDRVMVVVVALKKEEYLHKHPIPPNVKIDSNTYLSTKQQELISKLVKENLGTLTLLGQECVGWDDGKF